MIKIFFMTKNETKTGKKFLHSTSICVILVNGLLQKEGKYAFFSGFEDNMSIM